MVHKDPNDPLLTDAELIQTFTPLEHLFYKWTETKAHKKELWSNVGNIESFLRKKFPNQDPYQPLLPLYRSFSEKWHGRVRRRMVHVVERDQLIALYSSTPCKDAHRLAQNLWIFNVCNVADLFIGESNFGGVLTGYAVSTSTRILHPDITYYEMSRPRNPHLLDRSVLSLDRTQFTTAPTWPVPVDVPELIGARKRRQQNRSDDSISSSSSSSSFRSACSEDFEDREPFCFFQIGALMACTGQEWADVRDRGQEEINEAEWEQTGYGVVVELSPSGYPQGPVYVVYNFFEVRRDTGKGPVTVEVDWSDFMRQERPHIRRLYPNCNQKFFVAKIADKLDDLNTKVRFDFNVVCEPRRQITRAKLEGFPPKIIPNDVMADVQSNADIRKMLVNAKKRLHTVKIARR